MDREALGSAYMDTNVIISYVDEADPNHGKAVELVDGIGESRTASWLTIVELASIYSRAGLEEPLSLAFYSIRKVGAEVVRVDFNEVLKRATRYAPTLKLRTLDLLHVVTCATVKCRKFVTLDSDIVKKLSEVRRTLNIEVVTIG